MAGLARVCQRGRHVNGCRKRRYRPCSAVIDAIVERLQRNPLTEVRPL